MFLLSLTHFLNHPPNNQCDQIGRLFKKRSNCFCGPSGPKLSKIWGNFWNGSTLCHLRHHDYVNMGAFSPNQQVSLMPNLECYFFFLCLCPLIFLQPVFFTKVAILRTQFQTIFLNKNCVLQWNSNSDLWSRRWDARWPLNHHHDNHDTPNFVSPHRAVLITLIHHFFVPPMRATNVIIRKLNLP